MEWLKEDKLLIENNNDKSYANKKKSEVVYGNLLLYKLEKVKQVELPPDYTVDFGCYKLLFFYFRNIERNNFYIRENSSKRNKKGDSIFF